MVRHTGLVLLRPCHSHCIDGRSVRLLRPRKNFLGIARQIVCTGVRDGHHIAPLGIVYNENGFHVHDGRDKPFAFGKLSRRKH